jgi:hypothetical protein
MRYLKRNCGNQTPNACVFFSTETQKQQIDDDGKLQRHSLKLGVASFVRLENGKSTRRNESVFYLVDEFWSWLASKSSKQRTTWCFARDCLRHLRVLQFDRRISSGEWILTAKGKARAKETDGNGKVVARGLCVLDGQPFILGIENATTGGRLILVDSANYFTADLDDLGQLLGIPQLSIDRTGATDDEVTAKCRRDIEICERSVLSLIEWNRDNDLGNWKYTAPGNAMNAYRHRFMPHPILIHDDANAKQIERAAYYGGETTAFATGELNQPVYLLDVRSLFPSVMKGNLFPIKLEGVFCPLKDGVSPAPHLLPFCCAQVRIKSDVTTYPVRRGNGLSYVVGDYWTTLAGPELAAAYRRGEVQEIGRWSLYQLAEIFTPYVAHFWPLRRKYEIEGNRVYAELCKMYLNSLYGKFAALSGAWDNVPDWEVDVEWSTFIVKNHETGEAEIWRSVGPLAQRPLPRVDHKDSFAAVSAFVTSYARERMRDLRRIAGQSHVMYQGVDSLVVDEIGFDELKGAKQVRQNHLGYLTVKMQADYLKIRGKNQYQIGSRIVCSGLKETAITTDGETFEQQAFDGVASLFAPGCTHEPQEFVRKFKLRPIGQWADGTSCEPVAPIRLNDYGSCPF